jgi:hypothetical protein
MSRLPKQKGGLANELSAVRGAGSPVKFIVSVMPEASRSSSTSRPAKRNRIERMIGHLKIKRYCHAI